MAAVERTKAAITAKKRQQNRSIKSSSATKKISNSNKIYKITKSSAVISSQKVARQ